MDENLLRVTNRAIAGGREGERVGGAVSEQGEMGGQQELGERVHRAVGEQVGGSRRWAGWRLEGW